MSNDYYNASGTPAQSASLTSPPIRSEYTAITAGFNKLPALTGNAYKIAYVNASGSAMDVVGGDGLLKMSSIGVPAIATPGTDYVTSVEASITAASAAALADTDNVPFVQTSVAGALKKITWSNVKATLKTYFDTLYAALAGSVTQAFAAASIELGHATDTTLTRVSAGVLAVESVVIPSISSTNTLTNKRITPRVLSAASYTTDTETSLNCDTLDEFIVTAQAGALKFNNPTGTPTDGQCLFIAVTGTAARALTYDTQFEASTVALPSTTVTTARLNMGFIWSAATSKWIILAAV